MRNRTDQRSFWFSALAESSKLSTFVGRKTNSYCRLNDGTVMIYSFSTDVGKSHGTIWDDITYLGDGVWDHTGS